MKKVLFAIAALATSLTASAQLWVSGSLGFGSQSSWGYDDSMSSWEFKPAIGYALDDALEVGLELGISGENYGKDTWCGEQNSIKFSIAPFARYTFLSEGDFSMFLQGKVKYSYDKTKYVSSDTEAKGWDFGVYIQPGIKYALTDNFSMVATLGGLSYTHNDPEKATKGTEQNYFAFQLYTGLSFGLVYSF